MDNIINHTSHSLESFSFEALTQCITTIHSALQTSAVNAVNRFATIRNWLIGRYIVEYEQCGNDRAQYGAKLLPNIVARVKIKGINATLLANARNFYLDYPQMNEVVAPIFPMLSEKLKNHPLPIGLSLISPDTIFPTASEKFKTPAKTLISNLSFSHIVGDFGCGWRKLQLYFTVKCGKFGLQLFQFFLLLPHLSRYLLQLRYLPLHHLVCLSITRC